MTEYVDLHEAKAATPHSDLIAQLLDSRIPKSEREHAAAKEITALLAERDALHVELEKTRSAAIRGMDAATAVSYANLETAARLRAESSPEVLDSERAANAALTEEVETLRAERDALAKDAEQLKELLEAANCCLEFSVADAFMRHKNQAGVCKEWAMLKRQLRAAMAGGEGEG